MAVDRHMLRARILQIVTFGIALYLALLFVYLLARVTVQDRIGLLALLHTFAFWLFVPLVLVLPLVFMLRRWLLALPALLLAGIGIVWLVVPMFPNASAHSSTTDNTALTVVTFNLNVRNRQTDEVIDWLLRTDPDVIGMQEVAYLPEVRASLARLHDAYPYQFYFEKSIVFSQLPIVNYVAYELIEYHQGRTLLRTEIALGEQRFAFYSVRLSTPDVALANYSETTRNEQIARLLDLLAQEQYPFIMSGDFNLSEYSLIYGDLTDRMHDAYRTSGTGPGFTWQPRALPLPILRLDYIFYSDAFEASHAEIGPNLHSDHRPVVAELRLTQTDFDKGDGG